MDNWLYLGLVLLGGIISWGFRSAVAEADMSAYQKEQAVAVKEAQESHAKQLAKATDTILVAQDEYDAVRAERDRALERLRNYTSRNDKGSSEAALRARVAACQKLVGRLSESASQCQDGWHRCAQKHDALAEAVKP